MLDPAIFKGLDAHTQGDIHRLEGVNAAVDRAQAVIEFELNGKIVDANANFLNLMGYSLEDVVGKHHRIFCDPLYTQTHEYADFWDRLGTGEFESGEFKRFSKDGEQVWLQATYNPIFNAAGKPIRILKFAVDITAAKLRAAEISGKVAALDRAQAVIEFNTEGRVIDANTNFLNLMGYTADEVIGKHHRIFCDPEYTATDAYADFWDRLRAGAYESGEYRRVGKGGTEVWLQAIYNPILSVDGKVLKIVKFASDVTGPKLHNAEISARLDAVDRAQAVVEFDLEGNVLAANENFQRVMGYSLREIVGQHHSIFCTEEYTRSAEYRDFWLRLRNGELISSRFQRVGKYGREVHIQAAYNPIFDLNGEPMKVVKFAYDVTENVAREQRITASTREMTASVTELAGSIEEIARSSAQATELASQTHGNAEQGAEALTASLEAIALIQRSSRSISEIVRVMAEIANQTSLLAFNASIEAARAGEHGVGFSVVAGEVRKLAERSAEAAQQVAKLIEESGERVTEGSEVSKRAEQAFTQIVSSVAKTTDVIHAISQSTHRQQAASKRVDQLITELASADAS